MLAVNVDFRYAEGYPDWREALRHGISMVRCVSLPEMEDAAAGYLGHGIRVLAVYTGESDATGHYVMENCSALQIGNEPGYVYPNGAASWPTGSASDMINVWSHVANVLVPTVHPDGLPLIGPGIWSQDYNRWAEIASQLPKLSASAMHVYPESSGHSLSQVKYYVGKFAAVRADLPTICTEWTARGSLAFPALQALRAKCEHAFWYTWNDPGQPGHALFGTPELGLLAAAA